MKSKRLREVFGIFLLVPTVAVATPALVRAQFIVHNQKDMPGMDLGPGIETLDVGGEENERALCRRACELNPRCMAFTWVRRGAPLGGASCTSAKCWFKATARILLEDNGEGLLVDNPYTITEVKNFPRTACWARHIFNLKFCNVAPAGNTTLGTTYHSLECPPGSRRVAVNVGVDTWNYFCVVRRATDPGGLPNCTDTFGGVLREDGVIGNRVNHACLDAE